MLKTFRKGILTAAAAVLGAALLGGCGSGTRASDGLVHLNFQIWDNAQRGGMEAVARAYMDKNPEVEIQVQVTSWDEYWTKLDAAADQDSCRTSSGCTPIRFLNMRIMENWRM